MQLLDHATQRRRTCGDTKKLRLLGVGPRALRCVTDRCRPL
jgi:hypothetical protein